MAGHDRATALRAFETTVRLNDGLAAGWARLAEIYATGGALRRAEASLQNAVATQRGNAATLDLIGTVFRLAGNLGASLEWHTKAVEKNASHVPFLINLANAHIYLGNTAAAREHLLAARELEPGNAQVHWMLSRTIDAPDRKHVREMQELLKVAQDQQAIAYLGYATGKELEDLGDWEGAFDAWATGAAAKRHLVAWDDARDSELFSVLQETCTADWLEAHRGECFDSGPVFVIGEPRSGTTLLDRMLDAHPSVASAGELRHFGLAVRQVTGHEEPRQFSAELMSRAAHANMTAIGEAYVDMTSGLRLDAPHVIDKLPTNYLYLPMILAALPNARVIHMRREPLDACLAIFKQLFADAYLYSYDLAELAQHYRRYLDLMATWRERFPGQFVEVDYEQLVSSPEDTLRPLLQHIGLSWHDDCLDYFQRDSAVTTASAHQVREAPHQRSVGKWRHFEQQLGTIRRILAD